MQSKMKGVTDTFCPSPDRTVLYFDPDESYAVMLHDIWKQLHLAAKLHVVRSQQQALAFLDAACSGNMLPAAIVLDPAATGEATGAFVRAVRARCCKRRVPIIFWSHDSQKYKVLEGKGIESVHRKPMVLLLIQSLDAACQLGVKHFNPYAGDSLFAHTIGPTPQATFPATEEMACRCATSRS